VTQRPPTRLSATVLGTPDPRGLARFYAELLGWDLVSDEPEWAMVRPPGGGTGLSFQLEEDHRAPTWPAGPHDQQMQLHLDIGARDLPAAVAFAQEVGARLAAHQPQDHVVVLLDPAGHPFCLFADEQPVAGPAGAPAKDDRS
jgi:catechol 2,3-dioxygenase-like lactoylglutathione lyase family enzyme